MSKDSNSKSALSERVTIPKILNRKDTGDKITAVTAYDYTFGKLLDRAGVDLILVGDSLGCVIQGHSNTLPVTLDEVIYHTKCVARGVERSLVVGDLPFLSYQVSVEQALLSAGRIIKEGGAAAVKLEGGEAIYDIIARLVSVDIPVMGHVGLTPQSYHRMGGHRVQGKRTKNSKNIKNHAGSPEQILADATAVEEAGAFALVLEGIPLQLASQITKTISIPTIGIGAGGVCDGQILVMHDLLGLSDKPSPKFVKRFAELGVSVTDAVKQYCHEVKDGSYPSDQYSYHDLENEITHSKKKKLILV